MAWNRTGVLQQIQHPSCQVVEQLEFVFLVVKVMSNAVLDVATVPGVLIAVWVTEDAQGDGEAVLRAVGANVCPPAIVVVGLCALKVLGSLVLAGIVACVVVLRADVILGVDCLQGMVVRVVQRGCKDAH